MTFAKTSVKNSFSGKSVCFPEKGRAEKKNEKNTVSIRARKIILSDTEYKILSVLCQNAQKTVLRETIQELFENGSGNITDVYICKLRKKLEEPQGQRLIFTVREKGYKIVTEAEWR